MGLKADCLSRRPAWLLSKTESPDYNGVPDEDVACNIDDEEHAFRVIISAEHLLKDNPALKKLKKWDKRTWIYKDDEYIRTYRNFKHLSQSDMNKIYEFTV